MSNSEYKYNGVVERIGEEAVQSLRDHADGNLDKPLTKAAIRDNAMLAMNHGQCIILQRMDERSQRMEEQMDELLEIAKYNTEQLDGIRANPFLKFWRLSAKARIASLTVAAGSIATVVTAVLGKF